MKKLFVILFIFSSVVSMAASGASAQFIIEDPCIKDVLIDARISKFGTFWAELIEARLEPKAELDLPEYCHEKIEFCFKTKDGKGCVYLIHDANGRPSISLKKSAQSPFIPMPKEQSL